VAQIKATENIEVMPNAEVTAVHGTTHLERVTARDVTTRAETTFDTAAMFIFIGTAPRTSLCEGVVMRDAQGFVLTGRDVMAEGRKPAGWTPDRDPYLFETSVPGIFCAGDARLGSGKRVAAAVGEGSATVSMVHQYLQTV
jgi:thioredoxin reductase (NADPH)